MANRITSVEQFYRIATLVITLIGANTFASQDCGKWLGHREKTAPTNANPYGYIETNPYLSSEAIDLLIQYRGEPPTLDQYGGKLVRPSDVDLNTVGAATVYRGLYVKSIESLDLARNYQTQENNFDHDYVIPDFETAIIYSQKGTPESVSIVIEYKLPALVLKLGPRFGYVVSQNSIKALGLNSPAVFVTRIGIVDRGSMAESPDSPDIKWMTAEQVKEVIERSQKSTNENKP